MLRLRVILLLAACVTCAAAQGVKSFVGTIANVKSATSEFEIRPDNGEPVLVKVTSDTLVQRIAPGEKDLKKAEPIRATEISAGDRVLVSLDPEAPGARRIVVMSASDIEKRNQADQQDWTNRGVAGVVTKKAGNEVTLAIKSPGADKNATVTTTEKTTYRRYAPDSVKFADAKSSILSDIQVGDQLRARGQKSPDGLTVTADDVVFGTFLTKAGSVVSIDPEGKEIRITELGTAKPILVKLTQDTQVKAMPDFPGAFGGAAPPGGRGPEERGGPPGFAGGPPDPSQMINTLPPASINAVKVGQSIVISSTKGAKPEEVTAILIVANAQMLIQMATAVPGGRGPQGSQAANQAGPGLSPGPMSGMGNGLGFDLSGMLP